MIRTLAPARRRCRSQAQRRFDEDLTHGGARLPHFGAIRRQQSAAIVRKSSLQTDTATNSARQRRIGAGKSALVIGFGLVSVEPERAFALSATFGVLAMLSAGVAALLGLPHFIQKPIDDLAEAPQVAPQPGSQ